MRVAHALFGRLQLNRLLLDFALKSRHSLLELFDLQHDDVTPCVRTSLCVGMCKRHQFVVMLEVELGFVELRVDTNHALFVFRAMLLHAVFQLRQLQQQQQQQLNFLHSSLNNRAKPSQQINHAQCSAG